MRERSVIVLSCSRIGSRTDREKQVSREYREMDARLEERRTGRDDRQRCHNARQDEQHDVSGVESKMHRNRHQIEATAIVGIVRPMLAMAEPKARLRLICMWPRLAARAAASASRAAG
jgi:hypothetical protein